LCIAAATNFRDPHSMFHNIKLNHQEALLGPLGALSHSLAVSPPARSILAFAVELVGRFRSARRLRTKPADVAQR
jgi:hypothetical protein